MKRKESHSKCEERQEQKYDRYMPFQLPAEIRRGLITVVPDGGQKKKNKKKKKREDRRQGVECVLQALAGALPGLQFDDGNPPPLPLRSWVPLYPTIFTVQF